MRVQCHWLKVEGNVVVVVVAAAVAAAAAVVVVDDEPVVGWRLTWRSLSLSRDDAAS